MHTLPMSKPAVHQWLKPLGKVLLAILLLIMLLRWFEHAQVYVPSRDTATSADDLGRPWEEVFLDTSDGFRLHAWFFPGETNSLHSRKVWLTCHGNAGNISHRLDQYELILRSGVSLFAFDYRGYGLSTGRPSEQGTYLDADAAYRWLIAQGFNPVDIVVHGESLGGGIASQLAASKPVGGLVLQSTFTSIPDIGAELFPWLPVRTLSTIRYNTKSRLSSIHVPLMILHGREDEIIGFHHGEANFKTANEPKLFVELHGGHNDWLPPSRSIYLKAINSFLTRIQHEHDQASKTNG